MCKGYSLLLSMHGQNSECLSCVPVLLQSMLPVLVLSLFYPLCPRPCRVAVFGGSRIDGLRIGGSREKHAYNAMQVK